MKKKTTIYDIAKKLDITAATVSRALNDNPKISVATRKLVLETAREMNYEQNRLAKALKSGKSYNVGVVVPRINTNFFGSVIRGIEETLYPEGYHIIICQSHDDERIETSNINSLLNLQVDGILMSIPNIQRDNDDLYNSVLKENIPLIFFDRRKDINGVSSVTIDDFKGAYEATQHLIDQGYKRIAHISNDRRLQIFNNRYLGYKQAVIDNGLEFNENLVIEAFSKVEEGRRVAKTFLEMDNPPDGIFSASDFSALGAIKEIKDHGLRVPEDMGVIGFSNEPFTELMELSITSVDQSPIEMGKLAAEVFLEEVNNSKNIRSQKKVVLDPQLIIRQSSLREAIPIKNDQAI
ncbi:LacI family DNA-binding transcriptional regulator [Pseudotamlana carrageenivorans]|uniref:LacI family transcriptional regulator n=1 Tax=Pseudotamlana carrageenivorans TaxID=2069432 RepID=A0A2I7SEN1_9FLAO|nr:LacI family DNA-binding transcriptional regulator [Tamlana carrageenivorans]AUS04347.1 LacI family transcriptional regulator [Tamlana carrageenivorans]